MTITRIGTVHARARTESMLRLSKADLRAGAIENPYPEDVQRPKTRGDCLSGGSNAERPCAFVSCRYHLALDVDPYNGAIKENFADAELAEMPGTCALDVADLGELTLEDVSAMMNITRERVRQIEESALRKIPRHVFAGQKE